MCFHSQMDGQGNDVPTEAQMRVAYALLRESPLAATGNAYTQKCKDTRTSGDSNIPPWRCSRWVFGRIVSSISLAVQHDLHRALVSKKNPATWACLAEDASKGFEQICYRVAFKDNSVKDVLLDWKRHQGKKKAWHHGAIGTRDKIWQGHTNI